jgi:hypothetical protein
MANPTTFTFNPANDTFTFSNGGHLTIAVDTTIVPTPPQPPEVTVDTVTLTFDNPSPHDTFELPIDHFVVPVIPPPIEHLL